MRLIRLLVAVVTLVASVLVVRPYVHGLTFVVRAADLHGLMRRLADADTVGVNERVVSIPTPEGGAWRGRLYSPVREPRRSVLVVSGLHPAGIDEPRLVGLSRQLAGTGIAVLTPDIPDLAAFKITPAITDGIELAANWLLQTSSSGGRRSIALMGISFSGGLSIVAGGRPSIKDRIAYVFSFGGHDDLPRVLRYLCTGTEPLPRRELQLTADKQEVFARQPHDYGVAIILLNVAERVVPAAQVEPLRAAVRRFLWASHLDRVDKPKADAEFAALRELARHLPQPSATLLGYVNDRDVVHLGARLLPYVSAYGSHPALSVSKSPKPSAPVYLLHGADDNVIPSIESEYLAEDLRLHAPVRLLLSRLVSHAEADQPATVTEIAKLAGFWGDLLAR